ncbi:MAG: dihydroneopterin aldolase [Bacteroidales bacterium]|nr:dihydroneopterin aldolase [Bacteroidales bacterium]
MTGLIELQDIEYYAYHGCVDAEKKVGGRFLVNVWLEYDATLAAETDNINDALNYQTAYEIITEQMKITSSLLEHVGKRILDALFDNFPEQLLTAQVEISKMAPPMGGKMRAAAVTLRREKESEQDLQEEKDELDAGFQTTMFNLPTC